jgi:hypothetical protein
MRTLLSLSVVSAALLSSIATSPPVFSVFEQAKGKHMVDRGDDLELVIDLRASAAALPVDHYTEPLPAEPIDEEPDGRRNPGVEMPEPYGLLTSELDVVLEIDSRGTFGSATDTDLAVALWRVTPDGDVLVDALETRVTADETATIELWAGGVFATCAIAEDCQRSFAVTVEQDGDAKLRVKHTVRAHIRGERGSAAPSEADIAIDVFAL